MGLTLLLVMLQVAVAGKGAPTDWIPPDVFQNLKDYWATEDYKAACRKAKASRASSTGGSLHTGGSTTRANTAKKMESELGRPPTQSEIFERTHTRKEDRSKWVDRLSQETDILFKENLQKAEEEHSTLISLGITDLPPVSEEEVWSRTVGGRKRGRIYGVGRVSAHPTPPLTNGEISDDISTASGPNLREQITRLNRELTRQFELVEEERTKYAELEARYQAEREEWRQTHQRQQQEIK